ncbi:DUF2716 domain-containing protein [Streptomyces sp. NRRL S-448]|uniref:DUF2716 domain-containing protein n=1 Tax=Streptomyces sp. NRRL S-448 TaxID=1463907 RepID=UPI00356652CB
MPTGGSGQPSCARQTLPVTARGCRSWTSGEHGHATTRRCRDGKWPGSVYPDGDYHLYRTPELRFGTFGHPWEHTLCVFGAPLRDGDPVRRREEHG